MKMVKAKDFKEGMIVEVEMLATYHARKKTEIRKIVIEEDVMFTEGNNEVLIDYLDIEDGKSRSIFLQAEKEYKLIETNEEK